MRTAFIFLVLLLAACSSTSGIGISADRPDARGTGAPAADASATGGQPDAVGAPDAISPAQDGRQAVPDTSPAQAPDAPYGKPDATVDSRRVVYHDGAAVIVLGDSAIDDVAGVDARPACLPCSAFKITASAYLWSENYDYVYGGCEYYAGLGIGDRIQHPATLCTLSRITQISGPTVTGGIDQSTMIPNSVYTANKGNVDEYELTPVTVVLSATCVQSACPEQECEVASDPFVYYQVPTTHGCVDAGQPVPGCDGYHVDKTQQCKW